MNHNKVIGWIFIIAGAWWLLSGLATNDMGGIVSIGYYADQPLSIGLAPGRFLLAIAVYAGLIIMGIQTLRKSRED